jgi:catechol-2,3-dioxygenase
MTCEIQALGYIGIEVSNLDRWADFATKILGIEADRREDGSIDLRLDVYATRIRLVQGPRDDLAFAGWEVKDAETLARLQARLQASGLAVETLGKEEARDRRVAQLIRFTDPEGTVCEAF